MINRISPFLLEIILGIALIFLINIFFTEKESTDFVINNTDILQKIYTAFLGLNIAFAGYLVQEKDKYFIQFLREENADKWYLNAVFFNLVVLTLGIIIILLFQSLKESAISFIIFYSVLGINLVQFCTTFILWYNYIDLKRTFQEKR